MKFRVLMCLVSLALPMGLLAVEEKATPTPKPSLWHRMIHPFDSKKKDKGAGTGTVTTFKQLEMSLVIEPNPVKLADNRQLKVTLTLINRGTKMAQLDF